MDGNGRWAKRRLLPRAMGHRAGMKRMMELVDRTFSMGIGCCTVFALSHENFLRPKEELEELFGLFREYFSSETASLKERGISLKIIGDRGPLPADIRALIASAEEDTADGTRGKLAIAIGYGGRQDIVAACNRLVGKGEPVTEQTFRETLSTGTMPELDLLIRTGNEMRLSNFLLYESAYAELWFSEKMFPDFTVRDLEEAIDDYRKRERRFGRL